MQTTKTINELLVRFDDTGEFQGAHVVYLYKTSDPDTGKMLTASLGGPQAVAKASEADRKALVAVVGEALVALAEARDAAQAEADDFKSRVMDAEKRAADYAAELATFKLSEPVEELVLAE